MEYFAPTSVEEAVSVLDRLGEEARILAGGTDLLEWAGRTSGLDAKVRAAFSGSEDPFGCPLLGDDLGLAVARALDVSRQSCRAFAEANTWDQVGVRLLESLEPIDWTRVRPLLPR